MWIIIVALLFLAITVYLYLAITCFFTQVNFMAAYEQVLKNSGSRESALRAAMQVFVVRAPFNILNDRDIDKLVEIFTLLPDTDTVLVAQIFRAIDRQRDATNLKNEQFLRAAKNELLLGAPNTLTWSS